MPDHPKPEDAAPREPGPDAPDPHTADDDPPEPLDWESPRWQAGGADQQSDVEFERRYRNTSARPYGGAIDTPDTKDRARESTDPTGEPGRA